MNVGAVMDEIGTVLEKIPGLRVLPYSARKISPPAALLTLPTITFDQAYKRGLDKFELDITVLVSAVSDRASRDAIARYADGSGQHSVKAALEAHEWVTCDEVHATDCEFATISVAGVDYLGAVFGATITGGGA